MYKQTQDWQGSAKPLHEKHPDCHVSILLCDFVMKSPTIVMNSRRESREPSSLHFRPRSVARPELKGLSSPVRVPFQLHVLTHKHTPQHQSPTVLILIFHSPLSVDDSAQPFFTTHSFLCCFFFYSWFSFNYCAVVVFFTPLSASNFPGRTEAQKCLQIQTQQRQQTNILQSASFLAFGWRDLSGGFDYLKCEGMIFGMFYRKGASQFSKFYQNKCKFRLNRVI